MTIKLLARHFKDTHFMSSCECPIACALKELHPLSTPAVGFTFAFIGTRSFVLGSSYFEPDYNNDMAIARKESFGNTIIREIHLTEVDE